MAKKLAATLCSTGSTATFLHASEAVHGDLGVHKNGDAVIFFSNSSSTPELLNPGTNNKKKGRQNNWHIWEIKMAR